MNKKSGTSLIIAALFFACGYAVQGAEEIAENAEENLNISAAGAKPGTSRTGKDAAMSSQNETVPASVSAEINRKLLQPENDEYELDDIYNGIMRPVYGTEKLENRKSSPSKKEERRSKSTSAGKDGETNKKASSVSPENPLYISADKIRYNDNTGDVEARGNIDIEHMLDRYTTEYVYGNTLTQKYFIPGKVYWVNPTTKTEAESAEYDGKAAIGKFKGVSGWNSDLYYFAGTNGTYYQNDNKMVMENGYFTTKHAMAKVPDYRVEADSIEIYPGDHYTAHNVKLKFKNTTIISLSTYNGNLSDSHSISIISFIPRPTFDSDNGWGLTNKIEVPVAHRQDLSFYLRNRWYSKAGYKPDVGVRYSPRIGQFVLRYVESESTTNDEGGIWIKKKPSLEFESERYYLWNSPFYVGVRGEIAYWEEKQNGKTIKGPYKGFNAYISSNPIKLGKFLTFNWRAGNAKDYYDYKAYKNNQIEEENRIRRNSYYSVGLSGGYRAVNAWINYTDRELDNDTPYLYDHYSTVKPVDTGIRLQITPKDAISVAWTIDTSDGSIDHRYYTYYRDMHSFYGWVRYDRVEGKTQVMIIPKDFRF